MTFVIQKEMTIDSFGVLFGSKRQQGTPVMFYRINLIKMIDTGVLTTLPQCIGP